MNDIENIFQYKYKVEDLDRVIEKKRKGIESMIPEDMMEEVILREKEIMIQIKDELLDEGIGDILSDEETQNLIRKHKNLVDSKLEKERRSAHADEFITLTITQEEMDEMEELCATSYVRKIPNHPYHTSEEEMYDSQERKDIMAQMKNIGNMYYNITDWKNAMTILMKAWQYSKDHDYLGIPDHIKNGRVRLNREMPKLMIGYKTIVTDESMLKAILNGDIECLDKDANVYPKKTRLPSSEVEGIPLNKCGRIMGDDEFEYESQLARMGNNDSFVLFGNRSINSIYNRFSPDALLGRNANKSRLKNRYDENGYIRTFDFTQPGAGKRIFDEVSGKAQPTMADFAHKIMVANDNKIVGNVLSGSVLNDFATGMSGSTSSRYNKYTTIAANPQLENNPQVHAQEQALLQSMRMFNPNR